LEPHGAGLIELELFLEEILVTKPDATLTPRKNVPITYPLHYQAAVMLNKLNQLVTKTVTKETKLIIPLINTKPKLLTDSQVSKTSKKI